MKILAVHDGHSGCAWYRMILPLKTLEAQDPEVEIIWRRSCEGFNRQISDPDPAMKAEDAEDADLVIAERLWDDSQLPMWRRMSTPTRKTVFENDDDVFNVTQDNYEAHEFYNTRNIRKVSVERFMRTADMITTTTEHIAEAFKEHAPDVPIKVLPNYIPERVLDMPHDDREGHPRIGWVGGSSHGRDIHTASGSVHRFMERFPGWHMFVNGVDFTRQFRTPVDRTFHLPWLDINAETWLYYRTIDFDIGICPLLDTKFARSKSPIKALEYMARGIPVVASDVEPYRKFIKHGETGFLCKYDHEWLKYLSELASDEDLRLKMGAAAKEQAREYTIEGNARRWKEAYLAA